MSKRNRPQDQTNPDLDLEDETPDDDETTDELVDTSELSATEPGPVDGLTPTEQMATENYAYLDQTRVPHHETELPLSSSTEASQAELNPAFTPKAEDGGPANANGDSIGTAPNANDLALAAAQNAEDAGKASENAVADAQAQIDAGQEQQINAEQVLADAQAAAPEGIDAATGRPEGQSGPVAGSPSGMTSDDPTGETAGADK